VKKSVIFEARFPQFPPKSTYKVSLNAKPLQKYVATRVEMTDYPAFRAKGYDCGSGPTESFCSCLTRRLKGRGMRWNGDNAESIMALLQASITPTNGKDTGNHKKSPHSTPLNKLAH